MFYEFYEDCFRQSEEIDVQNSLLLDQILYFSSLINKDDDDDDDGDSDDADDDENNNNMHFHVNRIERVH